MRIDQGTGVWAFEAQRGDYQPSWIESLSIRLKCQPACAEHAHTPFKKKKKKIHNTFTCACQKQVQFLLLRLHPPFMYSHSSNTTDVTHGSPYISPRWITESLPGNSLLIAWWLKIPLTVPTHFYTHRHVHQHKFFHIDHTGKVERQRLLHFSWLIFATFNLSFSFCRSRLIMFYNYYKCAQDFKHDTNRKKLNSLPENNLLRTCCCIVTSMSLVGQQLGLNQLLCRQVCIFT